MTPGRTEQDWLDSMRAAALRRDWGTAQALSARARMEYPQSADLVRLQAGICQQTGRTAEAETLFRNLLAARADDSASAFALASLLDQQGRTATAARVMGACVQAGENLRRPDLAIRAIELLDDCGRKADAAAIAVAALALNPLDTRLHAYAGMLQMQLGEFDRAREHYLRALSQEPRAWEWHVPLGLANAQRYQDGGHPDFELFRAGLQRPGLSAAARAELHFALGKAHDDVGAYHKAAQQLREGNRIVNQLTTWSRKEWQRQVKARLASKAPLPQPGNVQEEFIPIFIVGMPRSGTTLLASLLTGATSRACNRGELAWIEHLATRLDPGGTAGRDAMDRAAAIYTAHSRQDDADDARWFIDKQPLNFRYVDLIIAMFPHARIIHCRRSARDTALSLWMQCFIKDAQGYAYDFDDIAQVMLDETQLMAHWQSSYPDAIREVHYEDVIAKSEAVVAELSSWLGFPGPDAGQTSSETPQAIATSSLWQARQPVYARSIGRWQRYVSDVPELLRFQE